MPRAACTSSSRARRSSSFIPGRLASSSKRSSAAAVVKKSTEATLVQLHPPLAVAVRGTELQVLLPLFWHHRTLAAPTRSVLRCWGRSLWPPEAAMFLLVQAHFLLSNESLRQLRRQPWLDLGVLLLLRAQPPATGCAARGAMRQY